VRFLHGLPRDPAPAHQVLHGAPDPANPFPMFTPKPRIENVEEVGAYAIRIHWSDGHSTGMYSFEHLRKLDAAAPA
jgi:hypothetical protein